MELLVARRGVELSDAESLAALEGLVGPLPEGYGPFVSRFGAAEVEDFVRVYPPSSIVEDLGAFRERWSEYWFWESDDRSAPSQAIASQIVIVADSFDGDEVVFVEGSPERLWLLPRNSDEAVPIGSTFDQAIAFVCEWAKSDLDPSAIHVAGLDELSISYRDVQA